MGPIAIVHWEQDAHAAQHHIELFWVDAAVAIQICAVGFRIPLWLPQIQQQTSTSVVCCLAGTLTGLVKVPTSSQCVKN